MKIFLSALAVLVAVAAALGPLLADAMEYRVLAARLRDGRRLEFVG